MREGGARHKPVRMRLRRKHPLCATHQEQMSHKCPLYAKFLWNMSHKCR